MEYGINGGGAENKFGAKKKSVTPLRVNASYEISVSSKIRM